MWKFLLSLTLAAFASVALAQTTSQNITIVVTAAVVFSPSTLNFPSTAVGVTSAPLTTTVTNIGQVVVGLTSISLAGTNSGDFSQTATTCGATLAVNATCTITLTFTPSGTGSRAARVNIVGGTTPAHTYSLALAGTGGGAPPPTTAYYVSPSGSDSNAGTLASPFLTIGRCQTALRAAMTNKSCALRVGTYVLPAAGLSFTTPADDGEIWTYYPADGVNAPILSGASLNPTTFMISTTAQNISFNGWTFKNTSYIMTFSQGDNTTWTSNLFDGGGTSPWYAIDVYGNNVLIANNTFQNIAHSGGSGAGIGLNSTGFTNSVVRGNTFQCLGDYGINGTAGGASGNIFANNRVINTGIVGGGAAPGCTTVVNAAGTGMEVLGSGPNLFVGNVDSNSQGYGIAYVGVTGSSAMPVYISDNNISNGGDPSVLIDMAGGSVVRRNTINSPGSIGMNLGEEHDSCPRDGYSNNLLVTNNNIMSSLEPIWVTVSQNSIIQGNIGNIGTATIGNPSPHWPAGISLVNWAADGGCSVVENSTGNTIQLNRFTSSSPNAKYGALFETNQAPNTLAYNVLFPFGSPGTAAVQNNSSGTITQTGNQTTASTAPLSAAPPDADAGASQVVASGQVGVTLNGTGSYNILGGSAGITYSWMQVSGTAVTLSGSSTATPTFTAPTVSQAAILGFKLTATTTNGSTYDQVYVGVTP